LTLYEQLNWLIGIVIGVVLIAMGYCISIFYLPKKTRKKDNPDNPDITLTHLKYLYLESYTLMLGGLFLVVLGLLLPVV